VAHVKLLGLGREGLGECGGRDLLALDLLGRDGRVLMQLQRSLSALPGILDAGVVMGTVGYMSPEQVRGREADQRSDIFSFGAILYEMLSGLRAFRGDSVVETLNAILKEDPPGISSDEIDLPDAWNGGLDFSEIVGQEMPKRALSIAALGGQGRADIAAEMDQSLLCVGCYED
jgi:serine/threonine protein kinase